MNKTQLTLAQQQILDILKIENKAMSAYALLNKAKPLGFHAPMQVYRSLKKLTDYGLIIKLDTLNMYLACELVAQQYYQLVTICTECQKVQIVAIPQLSPAIEQSIHHHQFTSKHQYLEVPGQCALCCPQHKDEINPNK